MTGEQLQAHKGIGDTAAIRWPSLLWPEGSRRGAILSDTTLADLALDDLARALDVDGQHLRVARRVIAELPVDAAAITYRQAIMHDLLSRPALVEHLHALLPDLGVLKLGPVQWPDELPLVDVGSRVAELNRLLHVVDAMHAALGGASDLESAGLQALRASVGQLAASPAMMALREELPDLEAQLGEAGSVTIGVNLDADLRPAGALLLSIQRDKFGGRKSLLGRLMGGTESAAGSLHPASAHLLGNGQGLLQRDLDRMLVAVVQPVATALQRFRQFNSRPFFALEEELAFWLGAARLDRRLQADGIAMTMPRLAAAEQRIGTLQELVNLTLALKLLPRLTVANDASFDAGRIMIITGPNHGGKTTFLRAIGQAQVIFQLGLRVAARSAELAPVDGLLTHFPQPEGSLAGVGRLDDEAQRLAAMFAAATPASLLLLNEPLTSTSEREANVIARDVVKALQLLGARTVFVTHLHVLAAGIDELNSGAAEQIQSLVAGVDEAGGEDRRTYRIDAGPPRGSSYAADIALRHGLTLDQLSAQISSRSAGRSTLIEGAAQESLQVSTG